MASSASAPPPQPQGGQSGSERRSGSRVWIYVLFSILFLFLLVACIGVTVYVVSGRTPAKEATPVMSNSDVEIDEVFGRKEQEMVGIKREDFNRLQTRETESRKKIAKLEADLKTEQEAKQVIKAKYEALLELVEKLQSFKK